MHTELILVVIMNAVLVAILLAGGVSLIYYARVYKEGMMTFFGWVLITLGVVALVLLGGGLRTVLI